jgi:hypothetical protein
MEREIAHKSQLGVPVALLEDTYTTLKEVTGTQPNLTQKIFLEIIALEEYCITIRIAYSHKRNAPIILSHSSTRSGGQASRKAPILNIEVMIISFSAKCKMCTIPAIL